MQSIRSLSEDNETDVSGDFFSAVARLSSETAIKKAFKEKAVGSVTVNEIMGKVMDYADDYDQANRYIKILHTLGADVDAPNEYGETPLMLAAVNCAEQCIKTLVELGADLTSNANARVFGFAVQAGSTAVMRLLAEMGADVSSDPVGMYTRAACEGHDEVMQCLLDLGVDINALDSTNNGVFTNTYLFSRGDNYNGAVDRLARFGANVHSFSDYMEAPLNSNAFNGFPKACKALIDAGAHVNRLWNDFTPLHSATIRDRVSVVKVLLAAGANVSKTDLLGFSPLHIAAKKANAEIINLFAEAGADVNECVREDDRQSPMELAICSATPTEESLRALARHGVNMNTPTAHGNYVHTALINFLEQTNGGEMIAHANTLLTVIELGADINFEADRLTPICFAAASFCTPMVKMLYRLGADTTVSDAERLPRPRANARNFVYDKEQVQSLITAVVTMDKKKCWTCAAETSDGSSFNRCAGCRLARYCSPACQRSNWLHHKRYCTVARRNLALDNAPSGQKRKREEGELH